MRTGLSQNSGKARMILLSLGAVLGLLLAGRELVKLPEQSAPGLPGDAVARVGGHEISVDRYRRVLGDLSADRRSPLVQEDRDFALQRLIDEELLVLQGIEMGLVESLPEVRKTVVSAVIAQTVAEAEAIAPTEEQLRELYGSDSGFFTSSARYRVIWLRGAGPADGQNEGALQARILLNAGTDPDAVAAATGLERAPELAATLMPLSKLRDYLGPELANAVAELSPGTATAPLPADGRTHVLYLAGLAPARLPPFDAIRPLVEAEFTRRQGDAALQRHLERLRMEHEVIVDPGKLAWP